MLARVFAFSYIIYNGKKIYLDTPYYRLRDEMKSSKKEIELCVYSLLGGNRRSFKKELISEYGECGL